MNNKKNLKEQELENSSPGISVLGRIFSLPTVISFAIAVSVIIFLTFRFDLDWGTTWLNIKNVKGVRSFPWCQHSIHVQIQAENGQLFSNTAQSCYSKLKNLIITDSIDSIKKTKKIEVLSCSKIFGEAMYNVHHNKSIDELFIT